MLKFAGESATRAASNEMNCDCLFICESSKVGDILDTEERKAPSRIREPDPLMFVPTIGVCKSERHAQGLTSFLCEQNGFGWRSSSCIKVRHRHLETFKTQNRGRAPSRIREPDPLMFVSMAVCGKSAISCIWI